jgi:GT2 family glycosyltransferase
MRFQPIMKSEAKGTHEIAFATGHAVLVRRSVFEKVNGYDSRYQRTHEDSDLCRRLRALGFSTYYVGSALSTTMQSDTLRLLAQK